MHSTSGARARRARSQRAVPRACSRGRGLYGVAERDGAAAKTATRAATEEARPPLTLTGVSSVGRDGASIAGGDLDAAVATVQARGTPVAIEHEEEAGAFSWMFGSAPQKPAVSTFGVVLERDEEADDGTKHKRKSMAL